MLNHFVILTWPGDLPLDALSLPEGFSVSIYGSDVGYARAMVLSPSGVLFVGSMHLDHVNTTVQAGSSNVYALRDTDKDNRIDEVLNGSIYV